MKTVLFAAAIAHLAACNGARSKPLPESGPVRIEMRDGTKLATEVFLPEGGGPFPTILIRTPYGIAEDAYAGPQYTRDGVAVVVQDLRGRYGSDGTDSVFMTDGDGALKDGYDTCAWIVAQPWSNGAIASIGSSARGITAYLLASTGAPGVVAIAAESATPNLYSDALFQDGVRRYALSHNWLEGQGSLHFEDELSAHPFEDDFWSAVQTTARSDRVKVAGVHVAGWYDIFQQGGLDAFMAYQHHGGAQAVGNQKLIVGPWAHTDGGELTYPDNAEQPPFHNAQTVVLDHALGVSSPRSQLVPNDIPNVQYYVMGDVDDTTAPGNHWRTADDWPPPAAPVRLYFSQDGTLTESCPSGTELSSYRFDPDTPRPTRCGNNLTLPAGACDQREVEARDDVLVFQTQVLGEPMEVTGRVRAHLFVDIDQVDADLMVLLTDVYPDGRSMLVAEGALRLAARNSATSLQPVARGEVVEATVDLWSTSIVFNRGHRLRVSVTSSNWPRYAINRNNGQPYPESVDGQTNVVRVNVHHSGAFASFIELPDPSRADDPARCDQ